jgi:hypothetical protein
MLMTSAGATARQAGRRPAAGLAAARTIVRLGGAPALRERLIGMLHPGTRLLILDLSRVRSRDQAGLAVLIGIQAPRIDEDQHQLDQVAGESRNGAQPAGLLASSEKQRGPCVALRWPGRTAHTV